MERVLEPPHQYDPRHIRKNNIMMESFKFVCWEVVPEVYNFKRFSIRVSGMRQLWELGGGLCSDAWQYFQ